MSSPLNNYLRSHRKRSGLTQTEVAFLLGYEEGGQVSRYEKGHRLPTLRTAIAFATIFGVSPGALFSCIQMRVDKEVSSRIEQLHANLEKRRTEQRTTIAEARKIRWLDERSLTLRKDSSLAA